MPSDKKPEKVAVVGKKDSGTVLAMMAALAESGQQTPEVMVIENTHDRALDFDPRDLIQEPEPVRLPGYQPPKQKKRKKHTKKERSKRAAKIKARRKNRGTR